MSPATGWHGHPTPGPRHDPRSELLHVKGMKHSYVMVALVVVAVVLLFSRVAGGAVLLLWPLACVGMMVATVLGMRGMGKPAQHTHPDGGHALPR